ncbi:MAG: Flp pilus assembly complex ATPase component TadA [Actinomycetota bacterium]|nr:Flp pilus assembly complex ATPase component TadA [Actinomycetota bacterium]MDQ2957641.1 Flp pilus assembly complex ATPase component TadA [Actinomycetota bacterium]
MIETVDYQLVRELQEEVADEITSAKQRRDAQLLADLAPADEQQLAQAMIVGAVQRHMQGLLARGSELPDQTYDQRLCDAIYAAMYGAGELQELLDDSEVENIDINGCDEVWITYAAPRGKERGRPIAVNDEDLINIVQNLGAYAGLNARPFTVASPELDLRLPDGSRLSAVLGATERPVISIRRNRFPQMFLHQLIEFGTIDQTMASFLEAAVRARCNIMVAGATDAGKTTLLRAMINCIPPAERIITVERALELGLRHNPDLHWDVVEMEEVLPDAEGRGGITIDQLVRRTRRHNPDRVIVGEVLGPEVVQMLSAMSQGNDGSLSTIHARDADDVFHKLATYAAQFERLDFPVTHSLMASSVDFVVFVRKNPLMNGVRCVTEVVEVTGINEGRVARSKIFAESPVDGRAERRSEVAIMRGDRLAEAGYDELIPAGVQWYAQGVT